MKIYLIIYHASHVSFMSAGDTSVEVQAKTPQEAVEKVLINETKRGWSVSKIRVFEQIEEPKDKWDVNYTKIIHDYA